VILQLVSLTAVAQSFRPKTFNATSNSGGYYEYLPEGYSSSQSYPLLIAVHGIGELGNGTSQIGKVLNNGVFRYIKTGQFPKSFNVNGSNFKFIVIAPQFKKWPSPLDVNKIIDYAVKTYKVDQNRIYVTGLSMGGGVTWDYAANQAGYASRLAAIVPVCGASFNDIGRSNRLADSKIPVWATHNSNDPTVTVGNTNGYISQILRRNPSAPVKKSIFYNFSHDAWTTTYNPAWRENGKNVYEWMLQYTKSRGATTASNKVPVAETSGNTAVTLPTNAAFLDGTKSYDPDGSISKYAWAKISGPSSLSIVAGTSSKAIAKDLTTGVYVFRLTVTDNKGATATKDMQITVNAGSKPPVANAGGNITLTLPSNSVALRASGSASGGTITSYKWSKISGPASFASSSLTSPTPTVSNLSQGVYVLRLTVTDNRGASASNDMTLTVKPPVVTTPLVANAGSDASVSLPINYHILKGSGSGGSGGLRYSWNKISGGNVNLVSPLGSISNILLLTQGSYVFELTVTDSRGVTAKDRVNISVLGKITLPGNNAPEKPSSGNAGAKVINVNLTNGAKNYSSKEWNNWNVVKNTNTASEYITSSRFNYSNGQTSTVSAMLTHSQQIYLNDNSKAGMAPKEVLESASYSTVLRTLRLSGLTPGKTYDIELYSSRSNSDNPTKFILNGAVQMINSNNNQNNKAAYANVRANGAGIIEVQLTRTKTYNYLNGFKLTEKGSSTAALSTENDA
ncbi:MAG: hypothetical protein EOO02_12445, partial [Chitinophagaceae bacterium]